MSKLRTDSIEPRLASNVDFAGLDVPSWNGIPFVLPDSPAFTGNPTVPTQLDSDNSTRIANTAFVKTRADNASAAEVTSRLASFSPPMNGAPSPGASTALARADHVHPTDTGIAALGVSVQASLGNSFFLNVPGTYSNIYTTPAAGTLYYIIVGGGGGGGGGGADLSGTPGLAGNVVAGAIAISAGVTISATVGAGGAGSPSGGNPFAVPGASPGQASVVSFSPGGTLTGTGGAGGSTVASGSLGGAYTAYTYFCGDIGDFAEVRVAQSGSAANTPSSRGGNRALTGIGTSIGLTSLSGNPGALNGAGGKVGGAGAGAAPSKAFVGSRGFYLDPVDGEGGDGIPTSAGGNGGAGMVYVEYQALSEPRAVTAGALHLLRAELQAQGFTISFTPGLN